MSDKKTEPVVMTPERLQEIEREVQLSAGKDPATVKLADGSTLADVRTKQRAQAKRDIKASRAFDERSREANRTAVDKVAVSVSPGGVVIASSVAEAPKAISEEDEIAARAKSVTESSEAVIVAESSQTKATPKSKK